MDIRHPFAFLARIVAIEHRGDGIDPQGVNMVLRDPVQGIGGQEIGNFAAPEIVDQRVPVRMESLSRVAMLVKRCTVKLAEAMAIGGKMRRHPVQDQTYSGSMA